MACLLSRQNRVTLLLKYPVKEGLKSEHAPGPLVPISYTVTGWPLLASLLAADRPASPPPVCKRPMGHTSALHVDYKYSCRYSGSDKEPSPMMAMLASLWLQEALMLAALTLCNRWGRAELARSRSIDCYAQSAMPSLPLPSPRVCRDHLGPGDLPEYPRHALEVFFCAGFP